ncbi:DUF309 domain-containing protein [Brevibacillus sp. SYP-B805]|uniref:DUF309 domain-containing protein n=1 Tax=Brevibacillus sp. SYP-B805 TaxID=1578199 RepID=UPI0013ED7296|nr:DUF309 domain-containing protein [Brevibacillus sp. SYP-B805]NGQ93794.1 DUF309 domain-containing protein [Brevibacillus sp. SYP-B805]
MYPDAYLLYLAHFHGDRDYFECHEILEAYWKAQPAHKRSAVWVGLIQIAVALYHQRRGNFAGAAKMMASAIRILQGCEEEVRKLGLHAARLIRLLTGKLEAIRQQLPYESFQLPIADPGLLELCRNLCAERGMVFGQASDLTNPQLIHKHTLRDRSEVIREREESLKRRQAGQADG